MLANLLSGQTVIIWIAIKKRQFYFYSSAKSSISATEMYKISNGLSPILIQEVFMSNNEHAYNLRYLHQFKTPSVNTVYHGTESISVLGPKIEKFYQIALKWLII